MTDLTEVKKTKILGHRQAFNSKCENIKWMLGGLVAQSIVISRPDIIEASKLPVEAYVDDLRMPTVDLFGLVLSPKDRQIIVDELLAACRRLLIADSADQLIESVCRAWGVHSDSSGTDPYEKSDEISFTGTKLYAGKGAASLLEKEEKFFIEKVAWPIRNAIRHNNAVIPPGKKPLVYSGTVAGTQVHINLERGKPLKSSLQVCYRFFEIVRAIGNKAFDRLLASYST
jgi:hypothetical protein